MFLLQKHKSQIIISLLNMIRFFITLLIISYSSSCFGQETKLSEVIANIAEELAADASDPEAAAAFVEKLDDLAENPVRINSSGEKEISRLFFLSDFQVKALIDYGHSCGRILSVYELVNIPGFDKETVEMMIPFITLDHKVSVTSDSLKWRNTSLTNISFKSGNNDPAFLGSPLKILTRYKFSAAGFTGGFTAKKDPGENLFSGTPPLPDFLSMHLGYSGEGFVRRIVIGDFSGRFGLGTNINTGLSTGLSLTSPGYMSARNEVKPYTSTDENSFFRGAAVEFSLRNIDATLFYSKNYIDASLGSLSGTTYDHIDNFYKTGLHNTVSLLNKKDVVSDIAYGLNLSYNFKNIRIGLTWSGDRYSLPLRYDSNDPAALFNSGGETNNLYSFYFNSLFRRILAYGEVSVSMSRKKAIVQGFTIRPSDRLTINFLYKMYDPGFTGNHNSGSATSLANGNIQSVTSSFSFEAAKHLFIYGGCEIRRFNWLKYRCSSPSVSVRQEIRVKYLPAEKITFETSFISNNSMVDRTESTGIPELEKLTTKSMRGSVRYQVLDGLILATRIDYKIANPSSSEGTLLLQDINFRFRQLPLSLWFRYCIFSSDSWDSRLYAYENDLLYSFSIPALSGDGTRTYMMADWKINKNAEIRIKAGFTSQTKSEGPSTDIMELKSQFRLWF
jgi:hypothetical protein